MIIGYFENFNQFNISFTIWALVPSVSNFNQDTTLQVNYSSTSDDTTTMPLLEDSNINNTNEGQLAFDMTFCFQKYYLKISPPYD